jgi:hypothetical protein
MSQLSISALGLITIQQRFKTLKSGTNQSNRPNFSRQSSMAMNWDILKSRYLQGNRAMQLDSLALNLTQIQTLAQNGTDEQIIQHLILESQFFIEWTVPTINLETDLTLATDLVDLQRLLSRWKLNEALWTNEGDRQTIASLSQHWCDYLHRQGELLAS